MSKPTVSAAGGAMPAEGHKTRRAALALFAGAPALAVLPGAALASTASPVHPDAALFAMRPAIDAADSDLEAALAALNPAEEAFFEKEPDRPKPPETILSAEERQAIDALRAASAKRGAPAPEWVAYEQAVQAYEREVERLHAECGVTAAQALEDAAQEAVNSVRDALVDTPAKTLVGLIFKARYAATHNPDEYDEVVVASIVDDLLAMAEGLADD
jgi:hypothetical protein